MKSVKIAEEGHSWPPTQGTNKMLRYIEDLIRNKNFRKDIKKLRQFEKKQNALDGSGNFDTYTPEQKKRHNDFNNEFDFIIKGYELLRKRCKKLLRTKYFIQEEKIASKYGLDLDLLMFAKALIDETDPYPQLSLQAGSIVDMCQLVDFCDDELNPANKGEEIIYLNTKRQLMLASYPIAICINQKASKRDVLDYIEKRWKWIENAQTLYQEKAFKIRKRKHSQEMIDFIWENKTLPAKKIKEKLNEKFPKNGLIYHEITKLIQLEKQRRSKEI